MVNDKNLFDFFPNYTEDEVLNAFNQLTPKNQDILIKVFGPSLKEKRNTNDLEKRQIDILESTINKTLKYHLKSIKQKKNDRSSGHLTNYIVTDMLSNLDYQPLTKEQETIWLKKLKLSFYHEVDLETRKRYLDYYCEVKPRFKEKYEKADDNEKQILLNGAIKDANEERKKFLINNQRLIIYFVYKSSNSVPEEELMQEANIGLMRALKKFDIEASNKFSTYAVWWIKQSINRYIEENGNTMRIPSNTYLKQKRVMRADDNLFNELHREPTDEEIALETGLPVGKVKELRLSNLNYLNMLSLNRPISHENESGHLEDLIPDQQSYFEDSVVSALLVEQLEGIINNLDERSQIVIKMRMGLSDGKRHTLDEVASMFNVSRERVRQLELKALKRIRAEYEKLTTKPEKKAVDVKKNRPKVKRKVSRKKIFYLILSEIDSLDSTSQYVLKMKYKYHYDYKAISSVLNIKEEDVIKIEKKALMMIKKMLDKNSAKTYFVK